MPTQNIRFRKIISRASATLASLALGALALGQVGPQIDRAISTQIPDSFFDIIVIASLCLLAIAVLMWLVSLTPFADFETLYISGTPKISEIPALRELAVSFFGETFASEQKLKEWIGRRKDSVTVIYKSKQR